MRQMMLNEIRTFGPACEELDVPRLKTQMGVIKDYMLRVFPQWLTVPEIKQGIKHTLGLEYPETSISAQLRNLRKEEFGSYVVPKRQRTRGTWEYLVHPKDGLI